LSRSQGVIISDVLPGTPAAAAGLQVGDVLAGIDGREVQNVPFVGFRLLTKTQGEKVHLDVLRGKQHLSFDVPVMEPPRDMDQVTQLADPEKGLVPALGIVAIEIDKRIAAMVSDLREPYGIIVAARAAGALQEVPLNTGDVIRSLNGEPMTTLERLRNALKKLLPGSAVALQIQRDDKLQYIAFVVE
jgi:serine protease Do